MPQRGSRFELTVWGVRLSVLRSFVWVVVAAGVASTGAAPPVEACTLKPNGPAPQGRHWHYLLDRAKRQCWHLEPLGLAAQRSATGRLRDRAAGAHKRPAGPETTAAGPAAAPAAASGADAIAPALPPPQTAGVSDRWLAAEPAQQGAAGETPDAIARMLGSMPAAAAEPAEAPATTALPAWLAAVAGGHNQSFAGIVVAAALVVIAGSVLWAMRWWRAQSPGAPPVQPARVGEPTPLVLARTAVRNRRPPGARGQAAEEIGPPRLPDHVTPHADAGGATRPSP